MHSFPQNKDAVSDAATVEQCRFRVFVAYFVEMDKSAGYFPPSEDHRNIGTPSE
jgi:hypothetical protein